MLMRWVMIAAVVFMLCYPARAQEPVSSEPPLNYLRGPSFPLSKHGPAWPKSYQPNASTAGSPPAESVTGTVVPEPVAPQIHASKHSWHYSKRCKRHGRRSAHCRIHHMRLGRSVWPSDRRSARMIGTRMAGVMPASYSSAHMPVSS